MTNEKVNQLEDKLREAETVLEDAGRMICSEEGAGGVWNQINRLVGEVQDIIHGCYKLRDF